jgi:hypothetical protein
MKRQRHCSQKDAHTTVGTLIMPYASEVPDCLSGDGRGKFEKVRLRSISEKEAEITQRVFPEYQPIYT